MVVLRLKTLAADCRSLDRVASKDLQAERSNCYFEPSSQVCIAEERNEMPKWSTSISIEEGGILRFDRRL